MFSDKDVRLGMARLLTARALNSAMSRDSNAILLPRVNTCSQITSTTVSRGVPPFPWISRWDASGDSIGSRTLTTLC